MIKAVFFDLDETLVDAMECHSKANRMVFESYGVDYEKVREKTKNEDFLGKRLIDVLRIMRDGMGITEEQMPLKELAQKREKYFLELVTKKAKLLTGAKTAIEYAKKKVKIVAITSSGTRKYIALCLQKFGLKKYVDFIVGEEDVTRGKPFGDIYEKAFNLLGENLKIKKEECLVVEDSVNGVKAAREAGIPVCFVPLYQPKEMVQTEYGLNSLTEFKKILEL